MKILVLGDIEGRNCWKDIVKIEKPDKIIFLGDLANTHFKGLITNKMCIDNFKDILKFYDEYEGEVIILRGNHDTDMIGDYPWAECYPRSNKVAQAIAPYKYEWLNKSQWVYLYKNICFSHAGVSSIWMENNNIKTLEEINDLPPSEIFAFNGKMSDYTGISPQQPPTWIRPQTLVYCGYKGVTHVVGHTNVGSLSNYKDAYINSGCYSQKELDEFVDVWCCDTLPEEYLIIEDDKFIVKKYGT